MKEFACPDCKSKDLEQLFKTLFACKKCGRTFWVKVDPPSGEKIQIDPRYII
jgi:ribosomal protein L37AE/L43A